MTAMNDPALEPLARVAWWDEEDPHKSGEMVSRFMRQIRNRGSWRYDADVLHAAMYAGNTDAGGVRMVPNGEIRYRPSTRPRNISRMAVDTYMSKVLRHKPLPKVQTAMGNWAQQRRAKKTTQWVEGAFHQARFFQKWYKLWVRDQAIFNRGVIKVVRKGKNKAGIERIFPWELFFDEYDARNGDPQVCYEVFTVDLGRALQLFGDPDDTDDADDPLDADTRRDAIIRASSSSPYDEWTWEGECDTTVQRVRGVHAYHLCDDIEAHDEDEDHECTGRHDVVLLGGPRLRRKVFTWPEFPHEALHYVPPLAGSIGMGLVESLEGWQEAIDTGYETLDNACRMVAGLYVLADNNADIKASRLQNTNATILRKRPGANISIETPAPAHPMLMQLDQQRPVDALGELGFSPMSTQGRKPEGLNSGIAISNLDEIEDERRLPQAEDIDNAICNIARKFMLVARDIAEDDGEMNVEVPMSKGLLPLKWSDVKVDDFQLRVMPASWLPQGTAAKLDVLTFLFDRMLISPDEFRRLLGGPDYEWALDLAMSNKLNVDEKLEAIYDASTPEELEKAENQGTPSNLIDPQWGIQRAQERIMQGEREGFPMVNKLALLRWIANAAALPPPPGSAPPGPPPGAGPPGMPPGPPGAPPMGPGAPMMPPTPPGGAPIQ